MNKFQKIQVGQKVYYNHNSELKRGLIECIVIYVGKDFFKTDYGNVKFSIKEGE